MKIKAAVLKEIGGKLNIEDVEMQGPQKGQLLVRITNSGICHTDEAVRNGLMLGPDYKPVILGHEGAGVVEEVGEGVTDFAPGDRVMITYASCGECEYCKRGQTSLCSNSAAVNFGGVREDGTFTYTQDGANIFNFFGQSSFSLKSVVLASSCIKIPDEMDLGTAAPLGCGQITGAGTMLEFLHAKEGETVAVHGCGAVGLAGIMAAKIVGCKNIIAVELNQTKLDLAKELGATHVINPKETPDVAAEIRKINPDGADAQLDTSGNASAIQAAVNAAAKLGRIATIAVMKNPVIPIDFNALMYANAWIGSALEGNANKHTFLKQMLEWYKEGRFPVDKFITHYPFEDINKAFDDVNSGKVIKAVLDM